MPSPRSKKACKMWAITGKVIRRTGLTGNEAQEAKRQLISLTPKRLESGCIKLFVKNGYGEETAKELYQKISK